MTRPFTTAALAFICATPGTARAEWYTQEKIEQRLKKADSCSVYILALTSSPRRGTDQVVSGGTVICVWDGVMGEDSVNEVSGCMLGTWTVETGEHDALYTHWGPSVVPGKKCKSNAIDTFTIGFDRKPHPIESMISSHLELGLFSEFLNRDATVRKVVMGGPGATKAFKTALTSAVCTAAKNEHVREAFGCK